MTKSSRHPRWRCVPIACWLCCALAADLHVSAAKATDPAAGQTTSRSDDDDDGELARKYDLLRSPEWQRATAGRTYSAAPWSSVHVSSGGQVHIRLRSP
jgi:hypothetical protein